MYFSIVIPTRNRPVSVGILIKQLYSQNYPINKYEVIVIHNDSTHNTLSSLKRLNSLYPFLRLDTSFTGQSYARNKGYEMSRYQHVIFLDDDVRVQTNLLLSFADAWRLHSEAAILGGKILPRLSFIKKSENDKHRIDILLQKYYWLYSYIDYGKKSKLMQLNEILCGALLSVNKRLLTNKHYLFNTNFGKPFLMMQILAEDYELCNRTMLENKQVIYVPTLTCSHIIKKHRFSILYILERHITAGIERYLMDTVLIKRYSNYQTNTLPANIFLSLKDKLLKKDGYHLIEMYNLMYLIFILSYFSLGPIFSLFNKNKSWK